MTMTVGAIAVIISTFIGVIVGGVSGYKGGKLDNLLMRLTEIVSSVPFLRSVSSFPAFWATAFRRPSASF